MDNDKSPRIDDIAKEFCTTFWDVVKNHFVPLYNSVLKQAN